MQGLQGNLDTMSIHDLLQWVEAGGKSGTLEVERKKLVARVQFREGRIVGCSSNAPATLIGQFLLSCGAISERTLGEALSRQSGTDDNLGQILLEMGAISQDDRDRFYEAKVEETIYGLFDWTDASFRFHRDVVPDPSVLEVDLGVAEVLRRGGRRANEARHAREIIPDHGIVLARRSADEPAELASHAAARRILGLIDGERTVAEILLHSHAPEFLVVGLLAALVEVDAVEVTEVRQEQKRTFASEAELEALAAVDAMFEPLSPPAAAGMPATPEPPATDAGLPSVDPQEDTDRPAAPAPPAPPTARPPGAARDLPAEINVALQLMADGKPAAALDLLNAMVGTHPGDVALRQLVVNAENDFCRQLLDGEFPLSSVPVRDDDFPPGNLSAEEAFILQQIDGHTNVQSLLWIAPMRDVDTLKALHHMARTGCIRVPAAEAAAGS